MSLIASPPDTQLILDLDTDVDLKITLPAGTYLTGGAAAWTLLFEITQPSTGVILVTKSDGDGITVSTAGSTTVDALFTISLESMDLDPEVFRKNATYRWKFKRDDPGSEVDMAGGTLKFRR